METNDLKKNIPRESEASSWIKVILPVLISVILMLLSSLAGYIVTNTNNIQTAINLLNADCVHKNEFNVQKTEFNDRFKSQWDTLQELLPLKEKIRSVEESFKSKISPLDNLKEKYDETNKDVASIKEKLLGQEQLIKNLQDENKQFLKDIQLLRERLVLLEGKKSDVK